MPFTLITSPSTAPVQAFRGGTFYGGAGARLRSKLLNGQHRTNGGGIDVCIFGDSMLITAADTGSLLNSASNWIRAYLQESLNEISGQAWRTSGFGFLPVIDDGATALLSGGPLGGATAQGVNQGGSQATGTNGSDAPQKRFPGDAGYDGVSGKVQEIQSGSGKGFFFYTFGEPSSGLEKRYGLRDHNGTLNRTSIQVVYQNQASGGTMQIDVGGFVAPVANTLPYASAQSLTAQVATSGTAACGRRSPLMYGPGLMYNQIKNIGTGKINIEGIIHFSFDERQGIRVHNLCRGGAVASDYNSAFRLAGHAPFMQGTVPTTTLSANGAYTDNWATNCGLRLYCFGTNECGTGGSPSKTAAQFKTDLIALCTSHESNPSPGDAVIIMVEPRNDSGAIGRWVDYVKAAREVAQQFGYGFLDLWEISGNDTFTGYLTTKGYALTATDSTHRLAAWGPYVGGLVRDLVVAMVNRS